MVPYPPEIIQGLNVDVPGQELKELMQERLGYHKHRIEVLKAKITKETEDDAEADEAAAEISKLSNAGFAATLKEQVKKHQDQTVYYKFMVNHINMNAIYRLNESELQRLGIQTPQHRY